MEIVEELQRANFDTPWKNILDVYFQSFIEICYPEIASYIDWRKGYESLDKELSSITKDAEIGKRLVDKLIKVWCLDGSEAWVLLHTEVQSQPEASFNERMFIYHYRLYDRYQKPIVSLAVLADDQAIWHPSTYEHGLWGCWLNFKFVTVKLLDFELKNEQLLASQNPFAVVILAHLAALKSKKDMSDRFSSKLRITRSLYGKGWDKKFIIDIYAFIDMVMALPEPLEIKYLDEIERFEEENNMEYITSAERRGMLKGERNVLLRQLQRKFGALPTDSQAQIEKANAEKLMEWTDRIITANSLNEIFATE